MLIEFCLKGVSVVLIVIHTGRIEKSANISNEHTLIRSGRTSFTVF